MCDTSSSSRSTHVPTQLGQVQRKRHHHHDKRLPSSSPVPQFHQYDAVFFTLLGTHFHTQKLAVNEWEISWDKSMVREIPPQLEAQGHCTTKSEIVRCFYCSRKILPDSPSLASARWQPSERGAVAVGCDCPDSSMCPFDRTGTADWVISLCDDFSFTTLC